ncbi:MAG: B12-binding domain-containing radical SAM protein [Eubacterium sp.]|nr:B12-binding domain-containing radical SAM protein [Eubacterium sp.]
MRVLLVYPEYPVTFWSFTYALKFINKKSNLPPLGILTVASMLPKEWELKLVDMNTQRLKNSDLKWADYVFISAMNVQKDSVRNVIDRAKAMGKTIVGGGPIFSTEPEKYDDVDHLLLYEGEISVPAFLKDLEQGHPKHIYDFKEFPEITRTPIPRWDLLDKDKYAMLSVQFSRGCPFHCEFCNIVSLFGHKPRTKGAEQLLAELDAIYNIGWRGAIFFVDDNFIGNKKALKAEILPAMIAWMKERDYPFAFFTEVSINISDDEELMDLMTEAGFDNVFIGIETVDDDCLNECEKVQNQKRDLVDCVKTIQQHGMQVQGGFIMGFDNEKPSIFQNMQNFIQRSGIVTAMVGLLTAPPGTKLYERMKEEDRLVDEFSGVNTKTDMNFVPKMDQDLLVDGYTDTVRSIYSPKNYYHRVKTFLENYKPKGLHKPKLTMVEITAFLKACFLLGGISKGRGQYWKLLFWTLKNKPHLFGRAVAFSIYGYHFRKCLP